MSANIQWKGTAVCIDITCPTPDCGFRVHLDTEFLYVWHCAKCDEYFEMGTEVSMTPIEPSDHDKKYAKGEDHKVCDNCGESINTIQKGYFIDDSEGKRAYVHMDCNDPTN